MILSLIVLGAMGCSEPQNNKPEPRLEGIQLPTETQDKPLSHQRLTYEDFPNEKTKTLNIEAHQSLNDEDLINTFRAQLLKDHFQLSKNTGDQAWSTNDCHLNQIIRVTGPGIHAYRASSRVGIGQKKDYFPDFYMTVFSFKTVQEADQHFKTLAVPVNSQEFCNGKSPERLVKNGRFIFYFATRAEMFRGYINQYVEFIARQKPRKE